MSTDVNNELEVYKTKSLHHSIKEKWIEVNLPSLYEFVRHKQGNSVAEKIFLLENSIGVCKVCGECTNFLSFSRGYREYCSKKCSNNDEDLNKQKVATYKKTSLDKWGVDNPAKTDAVIQKIKETRASLDNDKILEKTKRTNIEKWGVQNVSQSETIKAKKKDKWSRNHGVENPFQSELVKAKIKDELMLRYGVNHPLKSEEIKQKLKATVLQKFGFSNVSCSDDVKQKKFNNLNSGKTLTTLNTDPRFSRYLGAGLYEMKCDSLEPHLYEITRHLYHARKRIGSKLCTVCQPCGELKSVQETELFSWIKSVYNGEVVANHRDGLEIDIFLPCLKIGFEFNGLYWHSELFKTKDYHLKKSDFFRQKGIRVYHIWEDDWLLRQDIIKSQIRNWIGVTSNKIGARNCDIKVIEDTKLVRQFLSNNHIQGWVRTSLNIGLYHGNELVSLMTFDHSEGRKTMISSEWNLSRFCNSLDTNVVGAASKLLKYFISNFKPSRIVSFADKAWSDGSLYYKLGFKLVSTSSPNYSYLLDGRRVNKQRFKKSNLVLEGYDESLSESDIMLERGIYKIWDCGQLKFEFNI